jgi:hypothetical protein
MNERLQNLAREAGHFEFNKWDYFDINKFAELIVKESITMCDELKAQYLTSRKSTMDFDEKHIYAEGEAACDIIKYKMKKHFGVE